MLRWLIQLNVVVILKTVRKERMAESLNLFDFALGEVNMVKIRSLETRKNVAYDEIDPNMTIMISQVKIHVGDCEIQEEPFAAR